MSGDPTTPTVRPTRAAFAFVFVTVLLDMLALGVMVPILPKLVVQLEGGDLASAARMTGLFGFAWAAMQFVFAPVLGKLSDRVGRRPVILLSNLGLGVDYVLMALAPSLGWLFIGRLISGATAAVFPAASAYIADVTPEAERAKKFGMLGAAFGLGFIIGPAVGGALGSIDLRLPFWAAAALSLANAAYGLFVLPESLPRERRQHAPGRAGPFGALRLLRSRRSVSTLAAACFLSYAAHEVLPSIFVLYGDHRYLWDEATAGLALAAVGVCTTLVQAVAVGPLVRKLGERRALYLGLAFGVAGFVGSALAPTSLAFYAAMPLVALWGMTGPALQALLSREIDPREQGQLQGALGSLRGVTGMIGPIMFTHIFATAITVGSPGAPYLLAALLLALSLLVAALVPQVARRSAQPT